MTMINRDRFITSNWHRCVLTLVKSKSCSKTVILAKLHKCRSLARESTRLLSRLKLFWTRYTVHNLWSLFRVCQRTHRCICQWQTPLFTKSFPNLIMVLRPVYPSGHSITSDTSTLMSHAAKRSKYWSCSSSMVMFTLTVVISTPIFRLRFSTDLEKFPDRSESLRPFLVWLVAICTVCWTTAGLFFLQAFKVEFVCQADQSQLDWRCSQDWNKAEIVIVLPSWVTSLLPSKMLIAPGLPQRFSRIKITNIVIATSVSSTASRRPFISRMAPHTFPAMDSHKVREMHLMRFQSMSTRSTPRHAKQVGHLNGPMPFWTIFPWLAHRQTWTNHWSRSSLHATNTNYRWTRKFLLFYGRFKIVHQQQQ